MAFGPAYKGVPLCVATAMALSRRTGREIGFLFDRKEPKSHGDAGNFVGKHPGSQDRLVLVDDVITDGGTKRDAVELLKRRFDAVPQALVIAFDRQERGESADAPIAASAVQSFRAATGIPVVSLLTLGQLEQLLGQVRGALAAAIPADALEKIRAYRGQYGAEPV